MTKRVKSRQGLWKFSSSYHYYRLDCRCF